VSETVKARLAGLVMFVIGAVVLVVNWRSALHDGSFNTFVYVAPLFAVGGLLYLIDPILDAQRHRVGNTKDIKLKAMRPLQIAMLFVLAPLAVLLNWLLLSGRIAL